MGFTIEHLGLNESRVCQHFSPIPCFVSTKFMLKHALKFMDYRNTAIGNILTKIKLKYYETFLIDYSEPLGRLLIS